MVHRIAQLLNDAEDKIGAEIERLEALTGHQGIDVMLLSRNAHLARQRLAELGLDPEDTKPEELYHALRARYDADAQQLEAGLGLAEADIETKHHYAMDIARRTLEHEEVWTLRPAAIKGLLRQLPPTKTKKILNFRTLDSLLKRTNVAVIMAIARLTESATWQIKWQKMVKSQAHSSYEPSRFRFVTAVLPNELSAMALPETGTVVVNLADPPDMLGQVLRAVEAAETITDRNYSIQLSKINPALGWWDANAHLSAWIDGQPVSFNIFDIAGDHHAEAKFVERSYQKAASSLYSKLSDQYQQLIDELSPSDSPVKQNNLSPVMVAAEVENV